MDIKWNANALAQLKNKVWESPYLNYPVHSRIHVLKNFTAHSHINCFIKREDELSFGISGNKFRKYRTLLPYLIKEKCREALLLGGPYSNNLLSLTQLLLENNILPTLFLRGTPPLHPQGNYLFLKMLLPPSAFHWVPRSQWAEIDRLIKEYQTAKKNCLVIPEGASFFPSFPGALTLPLDILKNETELNLSFDHLFIDAGTGFSAAALVLAFTFIQKETKCHVLLLADQEKEFLEQLHCWHTYFQEWIGINFPFPENFHCYQNELAASFGSTNQALFQFLIKMAREQGILLDPIYSGKLFHQALHFLEKSESIQGNTLLLHSGGALTLAGFQRQLAKELA